VHDVSTSALAVAGGASALLAAMGAEAAQAVARWSGCGAMALTGRSSGPPLASPAPVALAMDHWAAALESSTRQVGQAVRVDGAALLGERAAIGGLARHGSTSAGGHTHMLRSADGWLALSLARAEDLQLLPAWLGADVQVDSLVDAVLARSTADLVERARLLGLPCAAVGEVTADAAPLVGGLCAGAGSRDSLIGARVVDLSSLWAGPLCAQLLGQAGARVVKVESTRRPDGARFGPAAFFDLLHADHESVALDLSTGDGARDLLRLVAAADIVIEASRPRALAALGCAYPDAVANGFGGVWLSITAHGREGAAAERVGFGDDAAAAGGLVVRDEAGPMFVADAVADPATGLLGAVAVAHAVASGWAGLLSVSLAGTCAHLAAGVSAHPPVDVDDGGPTPSPPVARAVLGRARALGADTASVLRTW